ncbi:MAG: hypothetical protein SFY32_01315 [Bacteroidota bacterium]|nr:hypothetical protein [Bacteroidota bacterium]
MINLCGKMIVIASFLLIINKAFAKIEYSGITHKSKFWSRVYPGGNIGLSFGRVTYIEASPMAGYWITDKLTAGFSLTYIYYRDNRYNFSSHTFGASPFVRYFILKWLFAHSEVGFYNGDRITKTDPIELTRSTAIFPFVGGGINFAFSERGGFMIMALYNLNYDPDFFLFGSSPVLVRIGFFF